MTLDEMVVQTSSPFQEEPEEKEEEKGFMDWLLPEPSVRQQLRNDETTQTLRKNVRADANSWDQDNDILGLAESVAQADSPSYTEVAKRYKAKTGKDIPSEEMDKVREYYKWNRNKLIGGDVGDRLQGAGLGLFGSGASTIGGLAQTGADIINWMDEDNAVADSMREFGEKSSAKGKAVSNIWQEDLGMPNPAQIGGDIASLVGVPGKVGKAKSLLGGLFGYGLPAAATDYVYTRGQGGDVASSGRNALFGGAVGGGIGSGIEKIARAIKGNGITSQMLREQGTGALPKGMIFDDTRDLLTRLSKTTGIPEEQLINKSADYIDTLSQEKVAPNDVLRIAAQTATGGEKGSTRAGSYLGKVDALDYAAGPRMMKEAEERTMDTLALTKDNPIINSTILKHTEQIDNFKATQWDKVYDDLLETGLNPADPTMKRIKTYSTMDDVGLTSGLQNKSVPPNRYPSRVGQRSDWGQQIKVTAYDQVMRAIERQLPHYFREERVMQAIKKSALKGDLTPGALTEDMINAGVNSEKATRVTEAIVADAANESNFAGKTAQSAPEIGGGLVGGITGAELDEENPLRGAAIGAAMGAGLASPTLMRGAGEKAFNKWFDSPYGPSKILPSNSEDFRQASNLYKAEPREAQYFLEDRGWGQGDVMEATSRMANPESYSVNSELIDALADYSPMKAKSIPNWLTKQGVSKDELVYSGMQNYLNKLPADQQVSPFMMQTFSENLGKELPIKHSTEWKDLVARKFSGDPLPQLKDNPDYHELLKKMEAVDLDTSGLREIQDSYIGDYNEATVLRSAFYDAMYKASDLPSEKWDKYFKQQDDLLDSYKILRDRYSPGFNKEARNYRADMYGYDPEANPIKGTLKANASDTDFTKWKSESYGGALGADEQAYGSAMKYKSAEPISDYQNFETPPTSHFEKNEPYHTRSHSFGDALIVDEIQSDFWSNSALQDKLQRGGRKATLPFKDTWQTKGIENLFQRAAREGKSKLIIPVKEAEKTSGEVFDLEFKNMQMSPEGMKFRDVTEDPNTGKMIIDKKQSTQKFYGDFLKKRFKSFAKENNLEFKEGEYRGEKYYEIEVPKGKEYSLYGKSKSRPQLFSAQGQIDATR